MYENGQHLVEDRHFRDHIEHGIPVQVYYQEEHRDIGYIEDYADYFVLVNSVLYHREKHIFVSRPGY
jgi:hypothetical protein